jgi:hypothetical protein
MISQLNLEQVNAFVADDPVRPHITATERTDTGRAVYALYEDKYAEFDEPDEDVKAIICVAYTNQVPTNEQELRLYTQQACQDGQHGNIAVFYTVWSYSKGAGRDIILQTARMIKEQQPHIERMVTLSPLTEMAEKFHLRNGASLLDRYSDCQNFEYPM